jgi:hypothetical protein
MFPQNKDGLKDKKGTYHMHLAKGTETDIYYLDISNQTQPINHEGF